MTSIDEAANCDGEDDRSKPPSSSFYRLCFSCSCLGRILFFLTGTLAILCSLYTVISCDFFVLDETLDRSGQSPLRGLPQDVTLVGLFSYSTISMSEDESTASTSSSSLWEVVSSCTPYQERFLQSDFGAFFQTAQFAAVVAPSIGGLALLWHCLVSWLHWDFLGSFLSPILLYLLACLVQGYSFIIYGEQDFCLNDSNLDCRLSSAGYASVLAMILYYLCSALLCFLPRSLSETSTTAQTVKVHPSHRRLSAVATTEETCSDQSRGDSSNRDLEQEQTRGSRNESATPDAQIPRHHSGTLPVHEEDDLESAIMAEVEPYRPPSNSSTPPCHR